jgi:acetyl esterase/lipase
VISDQHDFDPDLAWVLEILATRDFSDSVVMDIRRAAENAAPFPIPETKTERRVVRIPGLTGNPDISLTIYTPKGDGPFGCILHMHGGGFVVGSAAQMEVSHRPMAEQLGCVIASVDYRLAPENCFKDAIDDSYAALEWLFQQTQMLKIDQTRIGVMGESAGGGLAASLALFARDSGTYPIAFQHLVYPMIDDRTGTVPSANPHAGHHIWTPQNNRYAWGAYLGCEPGGDDTSPYAAAARAENLAGLPPCFMLTAQLDLFVDENLDYAARLIRSGVQTELHVMPGAFHAFDAHPTADVAVRARALRMEALQRALRPDR